MTGDDELSELRPDDGDHQGDRRLIEVRKRPERPASPFPAPLPPSPN